MTTNEQALTYLRQSGPVHIDVFDREFPGEGFDLRVGLVGNALATQDADGYLRPVTPEPPPAHLQPELDLRPPHSPGALLAASFLTDSIREFLTKEGLEFQVGAPEMAAVIDVHTKAIELNEFVRSVAVQPVPSEIPSWYAAFDWERRYTEIVKLAREVVKILPVPTNADKT
jgi:hypothetical protein